MEWIVSLTPTAGPDPLELIASPPRGADILEIRLDFFPGLDVRAAVASCPIPILATLRSTDEGGQGPTDPERRAESIRAARDAGAALIDLEFKRDAHLIRDLGLTPEQIVLSWHDPATPADYEDVCAAMLATPCQFAKAIPTANSLSDLKSVLAAGLRFNPSKTARRRLITFAMGPVGIPSRLLAPFHGPPVAFVAFDAGAAAAPGQLSIGEIESLLGHLSGPPTRLIGVVGGDVSSSLSPAMHTAGYRELNLPYLFLPLSAPDRADLDMLFAPQGRGLFGDLGLPLRGLAVTTPYKAQAHDAADLRSPRCARAGAANTLALGADSIRADNTDTDGVIGALGACGFRPGGRVAVIQGTGGAGRGAAVGLDLAGAEVYLRGRDASRTREIAERMAVGWMEPGNCPPSAEILVNATPLGGEADDPSPFTEDEISGAQAIVDMVYRPHTTALVRAAKAMGVAAADGREVLACQGFAQFAAFAEAIPPKEAMRAAVGLAPIPFR